MQFLLILQALVSHEFASIIQDLIPVIKYVYAHNTASNSVTQLQDIRRIRNKSQLLFNYRSRYWTIPNSSLSLFILLWQFSKHCSSHLRQVFKTLINQAKKWEKQEQTLSISQRSQWFFKDIVFNLVQVISSHNRRPRASLQFQIDSKVTEEFSEALSYQNKVITQHENPHNTHEPKDPWFPEKKTSFKLTCDGKPKNVDFSKEQLVKKSFTQANKQRSIFKNLSKKATCFL